MKYTKFSLKSVINELFKILELEAKNGENNFKLEFCYDFPESIESDKSRISQVLLNLLLNANKFSNNTTIKVFCDIDRSGSLITIKVKDNGIGI